jgi:ABC-type uncharacterized transport system involved in gliding motility auxiliary subunit
MAETHSTRIRRLAFSSLGTFLIICTLAALNGISYYLFSRLDFSAGHVYSISSGTKRILSKLKDNIIVKVYFTQNLPPPYGLNERYLRDLLGEYKSAAKGHMTLEFLDPNLSQKRKEDAQGAGITPVQVNVMARDKFEVKSAYMGLVLLYKGRSQALPFIQNTSDLEYEITSRIKKLTDPTLKTVGFVTGHGEKNPGDPALAALFAPIREDLNLKTVALDKPLPADLDALWILGPTQKFKNEELDALRAWLYSGKPLGIFLNRRTVNFQAFYAAPINLGIGPLLKDWGLNMPDGFVVDAQSENVEFQQQVGQFVAMRIQQYPYIPVATSFDTSNPAVAHLEGVTLPFVHPIFHSTSSASGLSYTSLVNSTKTSWLKNSYNIAIAQGLSDLQKDQRGPFSLAGIVSGDFPAPVGMAALSPHHKSRAIIIGTAYVLDAHFANHETSEAFLINILEWSCEDSDLLSIRGKGLIYRPLRILTDEKRLFVKYVMILFLPFALLFYGAFRYRRQISRRRRLAEIYGGNSELSAHDSKIQAKPTPTPS